MYNAKYDRFLSKPDIYPYFAYDKPASDLFKILLTANLLKST